MDCPFGNGEAGRREGSGASETLSGDFGAGSPAFFRAGNTEETLKLAKEVGTDPKTGEDENEYYPLGEGGILKALWEIADRAGLGLSAELRKLPIRQETIEITELFDIVPTGWTRKEPYSSVPSTAWSSRKDMNRGGIPAA